MFNPITVSNRKNVLALAPPKILNLAVNTPVLEA